MYLLSPEGKTVFFIPGVEVVHTTTAPLHLSEDFSAKVSPTPPPPTPCQLAASMWLSQVCPAHRSLTLAVSPH